MNKQTITTKEERGNLASGTGTGACCSGGTDNHPDPHPPAPQKTKLEKTQSLLTVISTSIGLVGVAGSVFAMGLATFYTGAVDIRPASSQDDVVVKVYTKEGHESTFHSKHIELMPGVYHLEISAPDSKPVNAETKIRFHKTNTIPVSFVKQTAAASPSSGAPPMNIANWAGKIATAYGGNEQTGNNPGGTAAANLENKAQAQAQEVSPAREPASGKVADVLQTETAKTNAKRRWWQFWKRNSESTTNKDD